MTVPLKGQGSVCAEHTLSAECACLFVGEILSEDSERADGSPAEQ